MNKIFLCQGALFGMLTAIVHSDNNIKKLYKWRIMKLLLRICSKTFASFGET